jgi:tetratricopeptide (TPR) repeat protein
MEYPELQRQLQLVSVPAAADSPSASADSPLPPGEGPGVRVPGSAEPEVDLETALIPLRSYSLLAHRPGDPNDSAGRVHRVMQLITREQLPPDQQRATLQAMLAAVDDYTPTESHDVRTWPVLEPLLPHAMSVVAHAEDAGIANPAVRLQNVFGLWFLGKALFPEAESLLTRAVENSKAFYGEVHTEYPASLNNLAQLLWATNRLEEAEPLMARVVTIFEKSVGENYPNVAAALNNLAALLKVTNRLEEAEPLMRRALAMSEHSFGTDHPTVAIRLNNLATLLQATNRLGEAEPLMRRALKIFVDSLGSEHPSSQTVAKNYQLLKEEMK